MNEAYLLDERELREVQHCLYYADECHHGTVGHNLLMLCAKLAEAHGFRLGPDNKSLLRLEGQAADFTYREGAVTRMSATAWQHLTNEIERRRVGKDG